MPQTKLEIFKIQILENSNFDFDKKTHNIINDFLNAENNLYINHSIAILTEDIEEYGMNKTINKYLVVSLIYKDLNASEFNLKNTSKKVKKVLIKEIEEGKKILDPNIETDFDKEIFKVFFEVPNPNAEHNEFQRFTSRETQILELMSEGKLTKEIAEKLKISVSAIETHKTNMFKKANVMNAPQLIKFAIKKGYLSPQKTSGKQLV